VILAQVIGLLVIGLLVIGLLVIGLLVIGLLVIGRKKNRARARLKVGRTGKAD
jgi:ABC-type transport system involved in multi-copper enzyme maturation permease subunit